eukprot:TRINITY_DN2141_c0_g1_i1.p1 TRINITY_DN2141_c0_g1~~TRINITY_DN2141_c0_g1_i1.p1  ORF type:complete len:449 (+),score=87.20 TRINITY_DN2141_c0_g1_i1:55-1347(+)
MPKDKSKKKDKHVDPLYKQITEEDQFKKPKNKKESTDKQFQDDDFLPKSLSQKLLKQVQEQQAEVESESSKDLVEKVIQQNMASLEVETPYESEDDQEQEYNVLQEESLDIDPADEAALELFMGGGKKTLDLGALIMQKIKEKEQMATTPDQLLKSTLEPKLISVYSQIGAILKTYRSGRLPKAIKILPLLSNWEEILYITQPSEWSPGAVRQVTRIFASNLNEKMAQRFCNLVLLPQLREDIRVNKKLNWHIYMALKKAMYKPGAFYKGILIPLCESRDCTLREAIIVGSIIRKVSVPSLPSSVALLKIAGMPYSGSNSLFIRILIDKKYALPVRVVDALVQHFLNFKGETRTLPVVWHQSLLSFAQKYKQDITMDQKQALKLLLREKNHPKITPEIRRELFSTKCRGQIDGETFKADEVDDMTIENHN